MENFMKVLRETNVICPFCSAELKGYLIQKDNSVILYRKCSLDGITETVLSRNPFYYAELDRFYFKILKKGRPKGRATNFWMLLNHECQMQCSYCPITIENFPFLKCQDINKTDFNNIMRDTKKEKLTLSGGEPTLHPDIIYFLKRAAKLRKHVQLATNGLQLSDSNFCKSLKEAGIKEIRISYEALSPIPKHSKIYEFNKYVNMKLLALEHLEKLGLSVNLSPIIFRGINEDLLLETLDYAKDRLFVKMISVCGFSWWEGLNDARNKDEVIMTDEMMDIICMGYNIRDRESIFTFQKALFVLLQLLSVRICIYAQMLIFVRKKRKLELIIDYFNMKRMKKMLKFWERFHDSYYLIQLVTFCLAMIYSMKPRIFFLINDISKMTLFSIFKLNLTKYPHGLLPLILYTTCNPLNADEEVGKQCTGGGIYKMNNQIFKKSSRYPINQNFV